MNCERCGRARCLVRFYDPITDGAVTLCERCFAWFANGRRKGGLPVPNAKRITCDTTMEKITV